MKIDRINKLALPEALVELVAAGRWVAPDEKCIERVFGESPSHANFYSFEDMKLENDAWVTETLPEYLGEPDTDNPPGDIDPTAAILIGDLGHDVPFALDYRVNPHRPRVVLLGRTTQGRWLTIAEDIDELISKLGLASDG
jgi:hypothetical protein